MNTHDVIQMGMTKTKSKAPRAPSPRPDRYSNQRLLNMINLVGIMAMMVAVPIAGAQSVAPSSLPQVDFSKMGTVALGGSFTGIDFLIRMGQTRAAFRQVQIHWSCVVQMGKTRSLAAPKMEAS